MNGKLLIAGGNIAVPEPGKQSVFERFAELCGRTDAKLMLAVCASSDPEDSCLYYRDVFLSLGVGEVCLLPLTSDEKLLENGWTDRADESLLPLFGGVTGVWFTGGDQLRTARLLLMPDGGDTPVLRRMRTLLEEGGVIGGSSAGAAIMSKTMIARGDDEGALTMPVLTDAAGLPEGSEGAGPEQLVLTKGLGFLPSGIVDQHFNTRSRLQRLIRAMEAANETDGYGVSEDTALEVDLESGVLSVIGSAYVVHVSRKNGCVTIQKFTSADAAIK